MLITDWTTGQDSKHQEHVTYWIGKMADTGPSNLTYLLRECYGDASQVHETWMRFTLEGRRDPLQLTHSVHSQSDHGNVLVTLFLISFVLIPLYTFEYYLH